MKIAVIVPAYNVEKYLAQCLDSLLAQTVAVDIYCCDDGSSDTTGLILDDYAARNPCVHAFHHDNRGMAATYNCLLDELPTCYDAFGIVDSDDYVHPEMYERLSTHMARLDADVVECGAVMVPADAVPPERLTDLDGSCPRLIDDMDVYWVHRTSPGGWINKWNKLYRRSSVEKLRFRVGLDFEDDYFFGCEVNAQIRRKVIVPDVLYAYRSNPTSMNGRLNLEKYTASAALRIRLSCETFLATGRIPKSLEDEWRRDLCKDAYRMLVRKNLKKNRSPKMRRRLFMESGRHLAQMDAQYGMATGGLNLIQRALFECCMRGRYGTARLLAAFT